MRNDLRPIKSRDDPRLGLYLDLRDRDVRRETGLFLAEGEHVVRRAFAAGLRVRSVLVVESKVQRVEAMAREAGCLDTVEVLSCSKSVMAEAAGIKLHQGIIAAAEPAAWARWDQVVGGGGDAGGCTGTEVPVPRTGTGTSVPVQPAQGPVVVCPEVTNVDNLGLLVRVCAGLGVGAMVLGPRCADPWYRRAVRVSMGAVFTMPICRSSDVAGDVDRLREAGVETVATVVDPDATPLREVAVPTNRRTAILLGSEGYGLPADLAAACDHRVRIPMHHDVDSLNVAVAAGIVIHHFANPEN